MKHVIFLLPTLMFFGIQGFGQENCDVSKHYNDFIEVQKTTYDGRDFLIKEVVAVENETCFAELINNDLIFVEYLLTNYSSNSNNKDLLKITASLALNVAYIKNLKNDSLFTSLMNEFTEKIINKTTSKDTITLNNLLNIAVKFFSILKITDEGYYVGKVCVGLNDIKKTEEDRKPFIEAFAFSSILKHYQGEEFRMYDEFVEGIEELYKVNLGIDKNDRLLRAQGAMFILMRNNEPLRNMLLQEYKINKAYLPFVLKE